MGLSAGELVALVDRVFQPRAGDGDIAVLVDLPDAVVPDTPAWRARREMAAEWVAMLRSREADLGRSAVLIAYRNAHTNNGDLPADGAWVHAGGPLPATAEALGGVTPMPWPELFARHSILIAPTQFSATAPLKVAARSFAIRAATMPRFGPAMMPALRIDFEDVNRRLGVLAALLSAAEGADLVFRHPGGEAHLYLDLRYRAAFASGGLLPTPGTAGNLPSGEAYIVPYEGERAGDPSRSAGRLPVEFAGEVVTYVIAANRAVAVLPGGPLAAAEAERLHVEPAYGNIAELGFGVLAAFGIAPAGEILLDEKLGLHIAFGRSDHFGGQVGPADFTSPDAVVHIDRVYVPACQPQIRVARVDLVFAGGERRAIMADDAYVPALFT